MTQSVSLFLALLAVMAQVLVVSVALFALSSRAAPAIARVFLAFRRLLAGAELWLAWLVAVIATSGSLYFSESAHFIPCRLCWFQRLGMYPLVVVLLVAAWRRDRGAWLYGLPLAVVGGAISIWHILVENGVIKEAQGCQISAPGGCMVKWINEFGYVTIPVLALSAFSLIAVLMLLAWRSPRAGDAE